VLTRDGFEIYYDELGAHVKLPDVCPVCGEKLSGNYDIHMVMTHPETRVKPQVATKEPSKRKKR